MTTPEDPYSQGGPQYPPPGAGQPPYNPGPPPQYPPLGGQPPQYPPPGGYLPPQFPPPGGPGGMPAYAMGFPGAYGAPPPRRSRKKFLFVALGVIVVLIVAIVVLAVVFTRGTITSIDDASVGDCISVSGAKDDATPKSAKCDSDSDTFTFIVAQKLDNVNDSCSDSQYSELTQTNKGKLCLIPNLKVGECYQFPGVLGGFSDFKKIDCSGPERSSPKLQVKVTDRVEAADIPTCTGQTLTFELPTPLSYCADLLTPQ